MIVENYYNWKQPKNVIVISCLPSFCPVYRLKYSKKQNWAIIIKHLSRQNHTKRVKVNNSHPNWKNFPLSSSSIQIKITKLQVSWVAGYTINMSHSTIESIISLKTYGEWTRFRYFTLAYVWRYRICNSGNVYSAQQILSD